MLYNINQNKDIVNQDRNFFNPYYSGAFEGYGEKIEVKRLRG